MRRIKVYVDTSVFGGTQDTATILSPLEVVGDEKKNQ
jgi:hypothetical protein